MNILTSDFHTHILPCVDDGSKSIEESVEMLKQEMRQGVKTICLTPHFNGNIMYPDDFLAERQQALQKLREALEGEEKLPELILSAEVQFCPGMSKWDQLKDLALGDTGYILIEMPIYLWTESTYLELEHIYNEQGLTPILAHIERYLNPLTMKKTLARLSALPVLLQCNSEFFINKATQRTALKLLNNQCIHLLGSDCHSATWRSPNLSTLRELIIARADSEALKFIANTEKNILLGKPQNLIV